MYASSEGCREIVKLCMLFCNVSVREYDKNQTIKTGPVIIPSSLKIHHELKGVHNVISFYKTACCRYNISNIVVLVINFDHIYIV